MDADYSNPHSDDVPALEIAYISDMRGWIGEDSFQNLIETVPEAFMSELQAVETAWADGNLKLVRETGHRLKGSASSLGCRLLADAGFALQHLPDDGLGQDWRMGDLRAKVEAAIDALRDYARQPPPPPMD